MKKNKTIGIVLGVFALVIVTTGASFAFFTYQRTGNTKVNVTSGDITFSYMEDNQDAKLVNAFPVKDSVGAVDITGEYEFTVSLTSSNVATSTNYNVILLDNNKGTDNYFTNDQIKFALVKNNVYVAGTSAELGKKLSSIAGFTSTATTGEGTILEDQEITAGQTDTYKLRIWISDDVSYNNDINDGTETGRYNGYTYSLKVKVTSGTINNTTAIENINVTDEGVITASISDPKGLKAYAVTKSSSTPQDSEWIEVTDGVAKEKSNIVRMASTLVTSKTINYTVTEIGTYYIHVKNNDDETSKKQVNVESVKTIKLATDTIIELASTNTDQIRVVNHEATGQQNFATTEYRYYGANPNNYVTFNNELWRIIGVFDVDDGTGKVEKRVKIIRNNLIEKHYSWDSSASSINNGNGINEWSQADLMTLLNSGAYYNRTTGTCHNSYNNGSTTCNFTTNGLTESAKQMIGNAKWYLGAGTTAVVTSSTQYVAERSIASSKICSATDSTYGKYCNDTVERTTSWTGIVGLMYPSDYGYAAGSICDATNLNTYNTSCNDTNWLFNSTSNQWTLAPVGNSSRATYVFFVSANFLVYNSGSNTQGVRPTTYLKSNIGISGGTGTSSDPFILQ